MPNWCSNTITIYEGDKPELEKLYRLITEWTSKKAAARRDEIILGKLMMHNDNRI